jgi:hypothetical protein
MLRIFSGLHPSPIPYVPWLRPSRRAKSSHAPRLLHVSPNPSPRAQRRSGKPVGSFFPYGRVESSLFPVIGVTTSGGGSIHQVAVGDG